MGEWEAHHAKALANAEFMASLSSARHTLSQ